MTATNLAGRLNVSERTIDRILRRWSAVMGATGQVCRRNRNDTRLFRLPRLFPRHRLVATRYEKTARNYLAVLLFAGSCI
ncbi:hypothetical protein [Nitratireductor sp. GCM10026969]|uniref:hypothetical protein n=1 Tax=Nitratireductor sp. GCM10026969 TaxID=3252645 RepID=UPI003605C6C9